MIRRREGSASVPRGAGPSLSSTLVVLLVIAGCASSPEAGDGGPVFENPPACPAPTTAEPATPVDAPATPRGIVIPAVWTAEETEIRMVVGADGRVDPGTVVVPGITDRRVLDEIRSAVSRWTFTPARRGPCWVASEYRYTIRSRRP